MYGLVCALSFVSIEKDAKHFTIIGSVVYCTINNMTHPPTFWVPLPLICDDSPVDTICNLKTYTVVVCKINKQKITTYKLKKCKIKTIKN